MSEACSQERTQPTSAPRCTGQQADAARAGWDFWAGVSGPRNRAPSWHPLAPDRALSTFKRHVQTPCLMQGGTQPDLPPGLTLAQRGGRGHSKDRGRSQAPFPGIPPPGWGSFVGGATGENIQRDISGGENISKGTGHRYTGCFVITNSSTHPANSHLGFTEPRDGRHLPSPPHPSWKQAKGR